MVVSALLYYNEAVTIFISDDQVGGDCQKIGNWDPQSKTCTLNRNLQNMKSIQVNGNGITIDGNNYSIIGDGDVPGIKILSKSQVTIKNLQLENFRDGIFLENSFNNTLTNLKISQSERHGIFLTKNSNNNTISFNNIHSNVEHGISIRDSVNNFLIGNDIKQTRDGIRISNANNTIITRNTLAENQVEGIDIHKSFGVMVYHNNIFHHDETLIIDNNPENLNTFFISSGGNYYSDYDEPSEGCFDQNSDGFCDSPLIFGCNSEVPEEECIKELALKNTVNYNDPHPFTEKDGWDNLD